MIRCQAPKKNILYNDSSHVILKIYQNIVSLGVHKQYHSFRIAYCYIYVLILRNSSGAHNVDIDTHGLSRSTFDTRQEHRMADSHFQVSCNGPPEAEVGQKTWTTQKLVFSGTNWRRNRKSSFDMICLYTIS